MGLLTEQIELLEGEKEMNTIISQMRRLGKEVGEVGQYLEKSTGKKLDDISDLELAKIAAQGAASAQKQMQQTGGQIEGPRLQQYQQAQKAMDTAGWLGAVAVASKLAKEVPPGKYSVSSPSGSPIDIDVDISGNDLLAFRGAAQRAGKTFPQALDALQRGDISTALGQTIRRTLEPTPNQGRSK